MGTELVEHSHDESRTSMVLPAVRLDDHLLQIIRRSSLIPKNNPNTRYSKLRTRLISVLRGVRKHIGSRVMISDVMNDQLPQERYMVNTIGSQVRDLTLLSCLLGISSPASFDSSSLELLEEAIADAERKLAIWDRTFVLRNSVGDTLINHNPRSLLPN